MNEPMSLPERLALAYPNGSAPPYMVKLLRGDYQSYAESEAAYRELNTRHERLNQQAQRATDQVRTLTKHHEQQQIEARTLARQLAQPLATLNGPQVGAMLADAKGYEHLLAALAAAIEQAQQAEQSAREQASNASVLANLGQARHCKTLPSTGLLETLADEGELFTPEIYEQVEQARQKRAHDDAQWARANQAAQARQAQEREEYQAVLDSIPAMTDWQRLIQLAFGATPPIGVSDLFTNGAYKDAGHLRLSEARDRSAGMDVAMRLAVVRLCELAANGQATTTPAPTIWATAIGQAEGW